MDSFYTLSVDKNRHVLTTPRPLLDPFPPHLVHVFIECPPREAEECGIVFFNHSSEIVVRKADDYGIVQIEISVRKVEV